MEKEMCTLSFETSNLARAKMYRRKTEDMTLNF